MASHPLGRLLPGFLLCALISAAAYGLEHLETHLAGRAWLEALVLAILIWTLVRSVWTPSAPWRAGIAFSAKTVLEIAVVLLGASLNVAMLVAAGPGLTVGIAVVVALALVTITVTVMLPLYQTLATILIAYALMFLPRAIISLRASIAQAPIELERAASGLGRPPIRALWATTIRLSAPGAAAGMALAALGITNELTATQMLAPNGMRTLALAFWNFSGEIDYAAAAPYATIMVLLSLPLTFLLYAQSKRMAGR